jgi:hypothetical protein
MKTERSRLKNKQQEAGGRMQVDGCRRKDEGRLSRRRTEVGRGLPARLPKSGRVLDHLPPPHPM